MPHEFSYNKNKTDQRAVLTPVPPCPKGRLGSLIRLASAYGCAPYGLNVPRLPKKNRRGPHPSHTINVGIGLKDTASAAIFPDLPDWFGLDG